MIAPDGRLARQDVRPATGQIGDQERIDRLRLIRSENVGPITFRRLIARYGSAAAALRALPELAQRGGTRAVPRICTAADAEAELAALSGLGARLVAIDEADYPPLLAHVEDAPPCIAMLGDPRVLQRPSVAVVGARNASLNGRRIAADLAHELGAAGCSVVSGLAHGIDAAAHSAALASGTAAIVAGGIDVVYPQDHRDLYAAIAEPSPRCRRAFVRRLDTSPGATASSREHAGASWLSRPACARAP